MIPAPGLAGRAERSWTPHFGQTVGFAPPGRGPTGAILAFVWRAMLIGALGACSLPMLALAQSVDDEATVNGEGDDDRLAADRPPRGPNREPLTLERDPGLALSPAWTFVGLGVTAALGGVMVWSLIDTLEASDRYHANPTRERYEAGRGKLRRTWVLGATCTVLAVATLLVAILGTNWGDDDDGLALAPEIGPGAGGLSLLGRF